MLMLFQRWRSGTARIGRLTPGDAQRLCEIHALAFARGWLAHEFETLLGSSTGLGYGARLGSGVLGFSVMRIAADEAELLTITTAPEWRGCGIAHRLLEHSLEGAARQGAKRLFLEVNDGNVPALALYQRQGFTQVGRRKGYYVGENGGDALIMRRDLDDRLRGPYPDAVEN